MRLIEGGEVKCFVFRRNMRICNLKRRTISMRHLRGAPNVETKTTPPLTLFTPVGKKEACQHFQLVFASRCSIPLLTSRSFPSMRPSSIATSRWVWLLVLGINGNIAAAQTPSVARVAPQNKQAQPKPPAAEVLRVVVAGATLHKPDKSVENLGRGTRIEVSKVRDGWIGGYALVGETRVPGWILKADLQAVPHRAAIEAAVTKLTALGVAIERDAHDLPHSATCEDAQLSDKDLAAFKPLVDLIELDLSGTGISGAGLKSLAGLTGLERLHLDQTAIDDDGLQSLASLVNLTGLSLSETKITDEGLKHLAGMKQLKVLNLSDTAITDAGLAHLAGMKGMETLTLSRTNISGKGFSHFQDFQDLITLNLDGCGLGPKALDHFHKLGKIRILRMYDALVPEEDVDALEKAVDGLAIFR